MMFLRDRILSHLLCSASYPPISPLFSFSLHSARLLSAAAAAPIPPNAGFAVQDYLVGACGLTRPQAVKASVKLAHLTSPSKPDAVLAFLRGLGLSSAEVAAVVAKDPQLLCAGVETVLAPNVAGLTRLGLSRSEVASLIPLAQSSFRNGSVSRNAEFFLPLFDSVGKLLQALRYNNSLLGSDLERVVKPNIALLRECGLSVCDIGKLCLDVPRLLTANPERVRKIVACAERAGVPRGSRMFKYALRAVCFLSEENISARLEYLKKTVGWSDAEVSIAVSKAPLLLKRCNDKLQRVSEFLIAEVGLEPLYIAHRPLLLTYSLERRLRPRYYVVRFLKESGLLEQDRSYNTAVQVSEKVFAEKFMDPHREAAPYLTEDYAAACRGEVPTRFRFA